MKISMVTQDARTFVLLGRAMCLAAEEGALDRESSHELASALVAGILTGSMELDTYARVHQALAQLLEKTFAAPAPAVKLSAGCAPEEAGADDQMGVYLEVVGEAWDKVDCEEEACRRLKQFAGSIFDLARARFGGDAWFEAPVRRTPEDIVARARSAGLLVVSVQGCDLAGPFEGSLVSPEDPVGPPCVCRIVLGWGDRRAALDFKPAP